jgi:acyl-CoA synthetase (AMP-forming)/AMP-acid ligase II
MPPAWANFGVGSSIERRARIAAGRLALVGEDGSFTYAELVGRVRRLANGLQRLDGDCRGVRQPAPRPHQGVPVQDPLRFTYFWHSL